VIKLLPNSHLANVTTFDYLTDRIHQFLHLWTIAGEPSELVEEFLNPNFYGNTTTCVVKLRKVDYVITKY